MPDDLGRVLKAARLSNLQADLASAIGRYMTECLARAEQATSAEMRDVWLQHTADAEAALVRMTVVCNIWWNEYANGR